MLIKNPFTSPDLQQRITKLAGTIAELKARGTTEETNAANDLAKADTAIQAAANAMGAAIEAGDTAAIKASDNAILDAQGEKAIATVKAQARQSAAHALQTKATALQGDLDALTAELAEQKHQQRMTHIATLEAQWDGHVKSLLETGVALRDASYGLGDGMGVLDVRMFKGERVHPRYTNINALGDTNIRNHPSPEVN